jgi:hypothetical protein
MDFVEEYGIKRNPVVKIRHEIQQNDTCREMENNNGVVNYRE